MKYFFIILSVLLALACSAPKEQKVESTIYLERELAEFVAIHPNWNADEDTEKRITEKFRHRVINWSNEESFLEGLPFKYKKLVDSNVNGKDVKLAYFETFSDSTRAENSLLNVMQLQIKGIVSEAQLKDLTLDRAYYLKGHLFKQGKRAQIQYIEVGQFKGYSLGSYIFNIFETKVID